VNSGALAPIKVKAKVKATHHANLDTLRPFIAADWDRLVAEYIDKTCCSIRHLH
jgi:hypothetical protein